MLVQICNRVHMMGDDHEKMFSSYLKTVQQEEIS